MIMLPTLTIKRPSQWVGYFLVYVGVDLISITASVLCDRYVHAESMVKAARVYFDNMTATISSDDIEEWTKQIEDAESRRMDDRSVMDILRAKEVGADVGAGNQPMETGPGDEWIQLAFIMEERQ